jgi:hypothetical protein
MRRIQERYAVDRAADDFVRGGAKGEDRVGAVSKLSGSGAPRRSAATGTVIAAGVP